MEQIWGPERPGGQGLDEHQEESGNRAIHSLLCDPAVRDHVDLVITYRRRAYEVWANRGMIRFERRLRDDGGLEFPVVEQHGENPIANQDHRCVASCADEVRAATESGHPTSTPDTAFIEPQQLSYPHALERIAQLFDSPYAPDLVVSPKCYGFGLQPGQHGALDVVQSRAPLAFAGPGIRPGAYATAPRHVDIAPTVCRLMGMPLIDGADASGRLTSDRGGAADVYLKRQDGRVLDEVVDPGASAPCLAYLIVFDGLSNSELQARLDADDPAVRNLRRILDRSARFTYGSTVNFPSITWPSHSTILTGAWCGHHDIVNPTYYDRANARPLAPQGQGMLTESYLGSGVETLYEAFRRVYGDRGYTVSIHEPQSRGAHHAALEQRIIGPRDRLRALTADFIESIDPRYAKDGHEDVHREAVLDARGLAQITVQFDDDTHAPPIFVAHEFALTDGAGHNYGPHSDGLHSALAETDARLGYVLDMLAVKGLLDETLFIFTADHGMAAQNVGLRANPARHPERIGMKTVTGEPMIWLRDLEVSVERAADGRTARVLVVDHDSGLADDPRPVEGVEILVLSQQDHQLAKVSTNATGLAAFATPADIPSGEIVLSLHHGDFNPRHIRLDGTNLVVDLYAELYGERS